MGRVAYVSADLRVDTVIWAELVGLSGLVNDAVRAIPLLTDATLEDYQQISTTLIYTESQHLLQTSLLPAKHRRRSLRTKPRAVQPWLTRWLGIWTGLARYGLETLLILCIVKHHDPSVRLISWAFQPSRTQVCIIPSARRPRCCNTEPLSASAERSVHCRSLGSYCRAY